LFAGLRDAAGGDSIELQTSVATVAELRIALKIEFPQLATQVFKVAVDHCYAADGEALTSGCEIALVPPVSGG
jgi:molybdopterin converting factor subunit 1